MLSRLTPSTPMTRRGLAVLLALAGWRAPAAAQAPRSLELEALTWTELRAALAHGYTTILVPIGGTEQSGPQLALGKHNARARLLAERIAQALGNALVAPVIAYVPEGGIDPPTGHMRFAGTISIPEGAFEQTLAGAAASLRAHGFRDIVFLGDHGGYQPALRRVAARLAKAWAGSGTRAWAPPEYYEASSAGFADILRRRGYPEGEIGTHAALADTALQLALAPDTVRQDALTAPRAPGPAEGVYGGDPRRATAALGQAGVDAIVARTVAAVRRDTARPR